MTEFLGISFLGMVVLYLTFHAQLGAYRKRIHFLEVKLDSLIKRTGIEFDDITLVPLEVHDAVKSGHRLKAIKLYRKITGAGLKEASEAVDGLFKNI